MSGQGRRGMRPAVTAALVASAFCLVAPHPAYADPTPPPGTTVPDPGTAPYTTDQTPAQVPTVAGPLAAQIITESSAVELLGEQVTAMNADVAAANQALAGAYATWQAAHQAMVQAQQDAADAASRAYQDADSMGPLDGLSDALSGLGALAPGLNTVVPVTPPDPKVLAAAAAEAQQREQDTFAAYRSAQATAQALANQQSTLKAGYDQRRAALTDLISRNQAAADAVQAVQDARDAALAGRYAAGSNVHGEVANPKALAALAWAVRQIGKPYEWGAEGPNSFDCSGLVQYIYKQLGKSLPRTTDAQFAATTRVSQ
ncbi:MAG TPA: NlpC/P60 family protein, partial [Rugosimonospora sp.]|nr:NlpC/P60 family protein [Rugosimonospora sp.]